MGIKTISWHKRHESGSQLWVDLTVNAPDLMKPKKPMQQVPHNIIMLGLEALRSNLALIACAAWVALVARGFLGHA